MILGGERELMVYCRVGSLEKQLLLTCIFFSVYCRVGSLEMIIFNALVLTAVYCRVGSLENA